MSPPTAIITGADGNFAGHLIDACHKAGWKLALTAFDEAGAARLRDSWPGTTVVQADLADAGKARAAIDQANAALGGTDCLFNIAGGFGMADVLDTTPEDLEHQLDINFRSAFHSTRAVLPGMLERGHGFVLGVGAAAAIDGGGSVGAYAAAKGALVAWLKSVHQEVAGKGVDVALIYPMSAINTPGNREAMPDVDPASWVDPDELAASMLHLATRGPGGRVPECKVYPRA